MSNTLANYFPPGFSERLTETIEDAKKDGGDEGLAFAWQTCVELIGVIERNKTAATATIDAMTDLVSDLERRVTELEKSR